MNTFERIQSYQTFTPPTNWLKIKTIDMHTGGEPLRVILSGLPELKGNNVLEYRRYMKENHDQFRTALMFEPRGHADMYGCILVPPNDEETDFGILFTHNEGYSTMCGHATIAITKLAVEMEWVDKVEPITKVVIDAPCGRLESFAKINQGEVTSVYFHCVPSFVVGLDYEVEVEGIGIIKYDLAYGGAFYAYVDADKYGIDMTEKNYRQLIEKGMAIKHAVINTNNQIIHPFEPEMSELYGTIFTGKPHATDIDSRNVCIFAAGEVDRSPTGSGVSGRMAIHHKRGELQTGDSMSIESIIGSSFIGTVYKEEKYGPFHAVIPQVEGTAHITGQNEFLIDPKDPFKDGFILR
ncbi:MAG: proline racemase family protein [Reichenbachiella sp.]|uniref:proline racemase family protein n=1 Tax=Reichenbachiella sp. TaxID=2184521 RepID=UPI0029676038|nr:proline racemase family protein [Reichenbachiella sp.]MDW3208279.1 proline racemase family protein [Reichenbachiella sp.]